MANDQNESKEELNYGIKLGKTYHRKDMPHVWIRADRFFQGSIEGPTSEGYRHIVPLNVIRDYFEERDAEAES